MFYWDAWHALSMDKNHVPSLRILDNTWYTVAMRYDAAAEELQLYVNGHFIMQQEFFPPIDDSANDNKLFWGGQDVDPGSGQGDLYSEADAIIAAQAWIQRALTPTEIAAYDGSFDLSDPALFLATESTETGVIKAGGSGGADGTNGNSPEFCLDLM